MDEEQMQTKQVYLGDKVQAVSHKNGRYAKLTVKGQDGVEIFIGPDVFLNMMKWVISSEEMPQHTEALRLIKDEIPAQE